MRLFEKMNKILRENSLAESYSDYVIDNYKSLQIKINKLKEVMTNLSQARRKDQVNERIELTEHVTRILAYINNALETYEYDLIDLCHLLKLNQDMRLTPKISKQVLFAINTKIELRKEFETIYRNFKSMAIKLDDIPMKEILKQMREVFDFDSKLYSDTKKYVDKKYASSRYYDSTTMQIRYILTK